MNPDSPEPKRIMKSLPKIPTKTRKKVRIIPKNPPTLEEIEASQIIDLTPLGKNLLNLHKEVIILLSVGVTRY